MIKPKTFALHPHVGAHTRVSPPGLVMAIFALFFFNSVSSHAQEPSSNPLLDALPAWMGLPPAPASSAPVPKQPILRDPIEPGDPDPASGINPPKAPRVGSRVQFNFDPPKMPDLSKIRQKAVRTTYQRTATGTNETLNESFSLEQVVQWEAQKTELASRIAKTSNPGEREELLVKQQQLFHRLETVQELARLLGFATDTARLASVSVNLEPLSPGQRQRFRELKEILGLGAPAAFPPSCLAKPARISRQPGLPSNLGGQTPTNLSPANASESKLPGTESSSATLTERVPPTPARIPERFYRPGSIPLMGKYHGESDTSETSEETTEQAD